MNDDVPLEQLIRSEIQATLNNFVKDVVGQAEDGQSSRENQKEALDKSTVISHSHANVFLVDQVVQMISHSKSELGIADFELQKKGRQKQGDRKGASASSRSYPYKIVEEYLLKLIAKVLTLDSKSSTVKVVVDGLGKIYERLAKKELLRDKSQPAHKLLTKIISHLCEVHLLPNLSAALQSRSALMLT